eukprot:XP_016659935.1 PREDICTED: leucine-rich repeat-containing protein 24-like [Acyrthosiphon pisum]
MTRPMYQDANDAVAVLRSTMVLLLLLLMLSLSSFPSVTAKCPEKCTCDEAYVNCYFKELDRIPDRIPPDTELLFLNENKVENIRTGVFNNLTSLETLTLDHNKIHKLDLEMFKGLIKLDSLQLDHNPLTCDCNILLFVNALKKNYPQLDVFGNYEPSCHFPVERSKKSLKELTENDFHCTSPDVIVVPENKTLSVGEELQLSCKAVGDPEPLITWAKDDIYLELGQRVQE